MVKAFVKGLLKKKFKEEPKDKKEEKKEAVPDELPPLAEDIVKEEGKKETSEETPKETSREEKQEEKPGEEIPDELSPIGEEAHEEETNVELPLFQEKGEEKSFFSNPSVAKGIDKGFFSNLLKITKEQGVNRKLLEKDLYAGMKSYYSLKSSVPIKCTNKKALQEEVTKKLTELQSLEEKWYKQKDFIEKNKQSLLEIDKKIKAETEELSPFLKKLSCYNDAPVGKYFRSSDGVIAKNIFDLLNLLKIMDDKVFKSHLNQKRNDFASWTREVIGGNALANKLKKVGSKEEMIFILENAIAGKLDEINTKKYLKPIKGAIIKEPKELASALKNMDDKTFNFHVNDEKNDFAGWISSKFKDKVLLAKVKKVKDKEELIKILEYYYKK